jgi:hypothetical protein
MVEGDGLPITNSLPPPHPKAFAAYNDCISKINLQKARKE